MQHDQYFHVEWVAGISKEVRQRMTASEGTGMEFGTVVWLVTSSSVWKIMMTTNSSLCDKGLYICPVAEEEDKV